MNTLIQINAWEAQNTNPMASFNKVIRKLVFKATGHSACDISLEDGFLEVKVIDTVKNTVVNGISKVLTRKTVLALDVSGMVPIEYQGSAEALGTSKYTLAEMVDELYA